MTFTLKPGTGGIMRKFEGTWYIKPDTDSDGAKGPSSIAMLRQQIMPLIHGPGLDWIVTGWSVVLSAEAVQKVAGFLVPDGALTLRNYAGVSKRQLGNLVEDLKAEVQRLNAGMPWCWSRHTHACILMMAHGPWVSGSEPQGIAFATGKPIPASQLKKPARNWKAAEVQGFALDLSDSDDDTEDALQERQSSKRPSKDAAVDSWPLLAAAMQAEGLDTGVKILLHVYTLMSPLSLTSRW